jgi:hypothetical protein
MIERRRYLLHRVLTRLARSGHAGMRGGVAARGTRAETGGCGGWRRLVTLLTADLPIRLG